VVLLSVAVWVEAHVAEPIVPLRIVRQRTTALAIVGSLAVGTAMFGSAVFLGQYFQISRGYNATQAGLLTILMMGGILVSSIVGGRLMSRIGKIKPFLVVQNAVPLKDIGAASSTVSFPASWWHDRRFRSGRRPGASSRRPDHQNRAAAYSDATGLIFLICAGVAVSVLAAFLLKPDALRTSLNLPDAVPPVSSDAGRGE